MNVRVRGVPGVKGATYLLSVARHSHKDTVPNDPYIRLEYSLE